MIGRDLPLPRLMGERTGWYAGHREQGELIYMGVAAMLAGMIAGAAIDLVVQGAEIAFTDKQLWRL